MRIAAFNVENLFSRVRAMNLEDWEAGKPILTEYSRLNNLLLEPEYAPATQAEILESLDRLGLLKSDTSQYAILRQNHGALLKRPRNASPEVVATGRGDWIGWVELKTESVNEIAMKMTARVIQDVNADILAVVEAENRIALEHFNDQLLKPIAADYRETMLIDGNDERGIDVGILTKPGFQIESMVSHINDMQKGDTQKDEPIFSRDCPEFTIRVGELRVLVMVNHFKSKGFGSQASSNAKRQLQAQRVREIYDQRRSEGIELIVITGDLNDTPASKPLAPLLADGSDLRDISTHSAFLSDGRPGTYGNGTASQKIDYLLLSPALYARVKGGGVFRKGVWGGKNGTLFPHYAEMTQAIHAASDHAAIWADIEL
ncbi:MAG: endonuclease/exonuclease/phosphatase family protein [Oscillatoriophycideae cyanobacterium NC_groundwater_1537_Pr4_S-0.65um_50_18]|nr:endonuclease/exonuclease/phosphatase family protein [Oscillatoriophycideae cyanobacterium NC_groundwater_1537_Pr4_S-0.65um_50_18]